MGTESNSGAIGKDKWAKFWRVLVVEDDPSVAKTLKMALARGGYEAELVSNAEEALAVFEPGKFRLVITDHQMAGMKGNELASVIKSRAPTQRIMILTGHVEMLREQGSTVGADLVVGKPFGITELLCSVHQLVPEGAEGPAESEVR